jgi:hypothetical protein
LQWVHLTTSFELNLAMGEHGVSPRPSVGRPQAAQTTSQWR